jgi:tetratricopeptide (TPR) repeat protein
VPIFRVPAARAGGAKRVPRRHPSRPAIAGIMFLLVATVVYPPPDSVNGTLWNEIRSFLGNFLPLDETVVRSALAAAAVLAALYLFRRTWVIRYIQRPGPIQLAIAGVEPIEGDSKPRLASPEEKQISNAIQRKLGELDLWPVAAVPGASAPTSNISPDVKAAADASTPLGVVAGLVSSMTVKYGYLVTIELSQKVSADDRDRLLAVSISTALGNDSESRKYPIGGNVEDLAVDVAHDIASFVLPRSKACRLAPWTAWQGFQFPEGLLKHYRRASIAHNQSRWDEALSELHLALEQDPQNPYFRIKVLQIYEQLGMFLEALAGYADVIRIESWSDRRLRARLDRLFEEGADVHSSRWPRRSRDGREAVMIARYRLVCRLAVGYRLASQWNGTQIVANHSPAHGRESEEDLKRTLRVWLRPYREEFETSYDLSRVPYAYRQALDSIDKTPSPVRTADRELRDATLRQFFQFVAFREAHELVRDYAWFRARRVPKMRITHTAMKVLNVWAPLYLRHADLVISGKVGHRVECNRGTMKRLARRVEEWPPDADEVSRRLRKSARPKLARVLEWQEHYNQACTYAIALIPLGDTFDHSRNSQILTNRAVLSLERAILRTDNGLAASSLRWITAEDQDLNVLRARTVFAEFLRRYFPSSESVDPRPEDMIFLSRVTYQLNLLRQYALARAEYARAAENAKDSEREALQCALNYVEGLDDWKVRLRLLTLGKKWVADENESLQIEAFSYHTDSVAISSGRAVASDGSVSKSSPLSLDDICSIAIRHRIDAIQAWRQPLAERVATIKDEPEADFWNSLGAALTGALEVDPRSLHVAPNGEPSIDIRLLLAAYGIHA